MIGKTIQLRYNLPETEEILFLNWKQRPSSEVPLIRVVHDNRPMLRRTSELEESKAHYRSKRVLFLVRDPRDVIVSSYFEMKNRSRIFGDNPTKNAALGSTALSLNSSTAIKVVLILSCGISIFGLRIGTNQRDFSSCAMRI